MTHVDPPALEYGAHTDQIKKIKKKKKKEKNRERNKEIIDICV